MHISDKLAALNWKRNQIWKKSHTIENARPAVFAFNGDVYSGLTPYIIPKDKIERLQEILYILSGLYGLLRPLDLIQPYRLEMGTKLSIKEHKNLYEFWKKEITEKLNAELNEKELFINLASKEYFDAVNVKALKVPVITPEFKEYKNGSLKIISFYAKRARGLMVRFIIDNNIKTIDGLKAFDYEGYYFDVNLSKGNTFVFTR